MPHHDRVLRFALLVFALPEGGIQVFLQFRGLASTDRKGVAFGQVNQALHPLAPP